jgi:hypothetical protein
VIDQMQVVVAQVLDGGSIRRASKVSGELAHDAQIVGLRPGGKLAHADVVGHALTQGADTRLRGHDSAPAGERGGLPHSPTYGTAQPPFHKPPGLAGARYCASGFVLRPEFDDRVIAG